MILPIATLTEFSQLRLERGQIASWRQTKDCQGTRGAGMKERHQSHAVSLALMASSSFGYRIPHLLEIKIRVGVCFCM